MENQAKLHKALADENRIEIIKLLLKYDLCVGALSQRLNISKSAISQHLKILREVGLVWGEKRGYFTHYMVNKEKLEILGQEILKLSREFKEDPSKCEKNCQRKGEGCYE